MANNADLITACQRIAGMTMIADRLHKLATPMQPGVLRDEIFRRVAEMDDNLCQACTELRLLAREPVAAN